MKVDRSVQGRVNWRVRVEALPHDTSRIRRRGEEECDRAGRRWEEALAYVRCADEGSFSVQLLFQPLNASRLVPAHVTTDACGRMDERGQ